MAWKNVYNVTEQLLRWAVFFSGPLGGGGIFPPKFWISPPNNNKFHLFFGYFHIFSPKTTSLEKTLEVSEVHCRREISKKFLHICGRTHSCVTSHIVPLRLLVHKGGPVKYDCQPSSPHTCSAHLQQATWIMHSDCQPVLSSWCCLLGLNCNTNFLNLP